MVAVKNFDVFQLEKNVDGDPGRRGAKDLIMYVVVKLFNVVIIPVTFYIYSIVYCFVTYNI